MHNRRPFLLISRRLDFSLRQNHSVSEMTYYVSSGTLNSTNSTQMKSFEIFTQPKNVTIRHMRRQYVYTQSAAMRLLILSII